MGDRVHSSDLVHSVGSQAGCLLLSYEQCGRWVRRAEPSQFPQSLNPADFQTRTSWWGMVQLLCFSFSFPLNPPLNGCYHCHGVFLPSRVLLGATPRAALDSEGCSAPDGRTWSSCLPLSPHLAKPPVTRCHETACSPPAQGGREEVGVSPIHLLMCVKLWCCFALPHVLYLL